MAQMSIRGKEGEKGIMKKGRKWKNWHFEEGREVITDQAKKQTNPSGMSN